MAIFGQLIINRWVLETRNCPFFSERNPPMKYGMNLLLWSGELNDGMLPTLEKLNGDGL